MGLLPFLQMHGAGKFEWDADGDELYAIRSSVGLPVAPPPGLPVAPLTVNDAAFNNWYCISTPKQPVAPLPVPNSNVCRCGGCEAAWLEAVWTCKPRFRGMV